MSPLRFLLARTILNSLRRTFQEPVRAVVAILTLFALGYVGAMILSLSPTSESHTTALLSPLLQSTIGFFMLMHLAAWLQILLFPSHYGLLFTEADVSFLFPSPLSRMRVMRFLMVRGLLSSLLFPTLLLFFYFWILAGRSLWLITMFAELKTSHWAWLLYPIFYVLSMGGAVLLSFWIGLKAYGREGVLGRVGWIAGGVSLVVLVFLWAEGYRAVEEGLGFLEGVLRALDTPLLYWLLMPFRAPAEAALIPYVGWTPAMVSGLIFWVGLCLVLYRSLARQEARLYEYGAQLAHRSTKAKMSQKNPSERIYLKLVDRARKGRYRVRRLPWVERWDAQGIWALLWRDLLINWRMNGAILSWLTLATFIGIPLFILFVRPYLEMNDSGMRIFLLVSALQVILIFQVVGLLFGQMDLFKRLDMQKPMPFFSHQVVLMETLPTMLTIGWMGALLLLWAVALFPEKWSLFLYIYFVGLSYLYPVALGLLILLLICPDQSDFTQRLLVGILMFPVTALCVAPAGMMLIICSLLECPLGLSAVLTFAVNAAVATALVALAGERYKKFNPVE